ncbi:NAD(P)/FAD-dependent oxidoreductase [Corynebacterium sp. FDAARGOS 1242]|uniref:NAD(P)/FAD-dependent oxidoreductase n=1 Tax=Corynebacterium sp. FDAARGOS 1242 TaxID=2778078 RepID=UPI0019511843|nr:NAD(P)/FAD-dependent oxidoreductase [Corynebacterium sp. FDAARGOS 1242]QRP97640.1 NAD(P)/FAD-dependent oxidoreductase [Corynebacterium sp. FDAARGOS 1242]
MQTVDTLIIGGGAAGLQAALVMVRARRSVLVVDSSTPRNRFAHEIHGVIALEGTPPLEFQERGKEQLRSYGAQIVNATVDSITDNDRTLTATLSNGNTVAARSIIVASGIDDQLPSIPGIQENWGRTVLHCPYCHGYEVSDKKLGVLSQGEFAPFQAMMVRQWSADITLFSNGIELADDMREELARRAITVQDGEVTAFQEHTVHISTGTGSTEHQVDALFLMPVPRPHDEFLAELNLERHSPPAAMGGTVIKVGESGATSHPRIWAVGNVANPAGQVAVAMGEANAAAIAVNAFLVEDDWI